MARFKITVPDWYYRRLLLWAFVKGTNRATLASNILQSRIEVNWDLVNDQLEDIAKTEGVSREELENNILDREEQS
jgi:hypothetical protein